MNVNSAKEKIRPLPFCDTAECGQSRSERSADSLVCKLQWLHWHARTKLSALLSNCRGLRRFAAILTEGGRSATEGARVGGPEQLRAQLNRGTVERGAAVWTLLLIGIFMVLGPEAAGAGEAAPLLSLRNREASARPLSDVLSPPKWREVENSVDRALKWLASEQASDGSFPTLDPGQPGVTSLAIMAFLSRGHQPGKGPYGEHLNRAIDYVLETQMENGMFSYVRPENQHIVYRSSHTAAYNHPIAGLMLGEVYGQVTGERAKRVKAAIEKALKFTREFQVIRPKPPSDRGGWRYLQKTTYTDSDMSTTAWQLMFLRSAKNAEFDVPQAWVDDAMGYVQRCWNPRSGSFAYGLYSGMGHYGDTRGTTGAGILSLSLGGQHQTPAALAAGDWLLNHPYRYFGELTGASDMFFYSTYYCSQAAAQLGGRYWDRIYPAIVNVLLSAQNPDGSWPPEAGLSVARFGNHYSTAMAVLSLTPPYQLLPVYQR